LRSVNREEFAAWLRLLQTPLIGREAARRLLTALGSPQQVFLSSVDELTPWVGTAAASNLAKPPAQFDALLERSWDWLQDPQAQDRHVLTLGDANYPAALLETADPPLMLYAQGQLERFQNPAIAVVGSRNATPQGLDNARAFSRHLSQEGVTVISGLALGIDGAAHEGALEGLGSTIAVVGTGLDRVYPKAHLALAHQIVQTGLILSEYAIGTPPLPAYFPQRNRIIAGLAGGTLVVEAALKSGSLITARLALECGRDVFAIPGSIHSPTSRGCHALIKQGAKLVETAQDILEEIRYLNAAVHVPPPQVIGAIPEVDEHPLLRLMGYDPITLDGLCNRSGLSAADLSAQLLDLEINGLVTRLPGQLFQRSARG
jgi:DNA processing protein